MPCAKDMLDAKQNNTIRFVLYALSLSLFSLPALAAEVRGTVSVRHGELFGADGTVSESTATVSVALLPAEGQSLPWGPARVRDILLDSGRIEPLYTAISRGDRVRFRNQDDSYHVLFAHSRMQPIEVRLDRAGAGAAAQSSLTLNESTDLHWFCRIHAKSYARIDVLDTPLVQNIRAGEKFEFTGLAPGNWLLRVAALGAETRTLEVRALTAPPPVQVQLTIKGFRPGAGGAGAPHSLAVERLFPSQPGR